MTLRIALVGASPVVTSVASGFFVTSSGTHPPRCDHNRPAGGYEPTFPQYKDSELDLEHEGKHRCMSCKLEIEHQRWAM
jgi:hypothetical protein